MSENEPVKRKTKSETPVIIYIAVAAGAAVSLAIGLVNEDLSLNIFSEVLGAAFTLFVIDVLLVRSKTRRWHIVQEHIDYLIGRTINRLRDGVATRAFGFKPELEKNLKEHEVIPVIRKQREKFLNELSVKSADKLSGLIDPLFFDEDNYLYFDEKAEDIWQMINMKYSEYLDPDLVALLIELHTNLSDTCAHIRVFRKSEKFPLEKEYYELTGRSGAAKNLKEIIRIVIRLKEEGYSEAARIV